MSRSATYFKVNCGILGAVSWNWLECKGAKGIQHMYTQGQTTTQADWGTCFASNCAFLSMKKVPQLTENALLYFNPQPTDFPLLFLEKVPRTKGSLSVYFGLMWRDFISVLAGKCLLKLPMFALLLVGNSVDKQFLHCHFLSFTFVAVHGNNL